MQERIQPPERMTFEEFFAFVQTRPEEERWELFDGEKVLQASPTRWHQKIVGNVAFELGVIERQGHSNWDVLPGLVVHDANNPKSAPLPDILVVPRSRENVNYTHDVIAAFEVLSPSTKKRDLTWKLRYYTGLATMQHYVVIAQDELLVRHFARADGWKERKLRKAADVVALTAIGADLPIANIYRGTDILP